MSNMTQEEQERYSDMAMKHANFLCDRVFKPAFEMAFIHGAKHMKEELMRSELVTLRYRQPVVTKTPAQKAEVACAIESIQNHLDEPEIIEKQHPSLYNILRRQRDDAQDALRKEVERIMHEKAKS